MLLLSKSFARCGALALLGHFLMGPSGAAAQGGPRSLNVELNGVALRLTRESGLAITVDGVPFSQQSRLYVVTPHWTERLFGWENHVNVAEDATSETLPGGGVRWSVRLTGKDDVFQGHQIIDLTADRRLRIAFQGQLREGQDGVVENRIATIQTGWIVGRDYRVEKAGGRVTTGTAPAVALSEAVKPSTLAADFTTLTLESRLGPLTVTTSGTLNQTLIDYRKNKWAGGKLYYWFGVLGSELKGGRSEAYEVTFQFPSRWTRAADGEAVTSGGVERLSDALLPEELPDRILPTPKKVEWRETDFEFTPRIEAWVEGPSAREELIRLAAKFRDDVQAAYGVSWEMLPEKPALLDPASARLVVFLEEATSRPEGATSNEWYRLSVEPPAIAEGVEDQSVGKSPAAFAGEVRLSAETPAGIANGFKTLRQLIRVRDGRLSIRGCAVEDYPSMSFRGIHFFTGRGARELQTRMVRNVLGPLKINQLVYQADYLRWDAMPKGSHNERYVMEKEDARAVAEEARRQGIEVIPMVNTFGHSEWLIDNPVLRHLADNPGHPYAYDPSNPEVYRICEKIYEEAIELFKPRVFHIGHDEVTLHDFPHSERNRAIGAGPLIIRDTLHYYHWLKARGLRTAMWGDMLLGPTEAGPDACLAPSDEEAKRRRDALPRDILITDWHYEGAAIEKFTSLQLLSKAGFDTVASTWATPSNVVRFAKVAESLDLDDPTTGGTCADYHGGTPLGLLQTTWAGYSFDETSFIENPDQYSAYVLAAEAAWTGGYAEPDDVPYDYRAEFVRLWNQGHLPGGAAPGWTLDLNSVANLELGADAEGRFFGIRVGETNGFFPLESGLTKIGRFRFRIAGSGSSPRAVTLSGQFNPDTGATYPSVLRLPVGARAEFLQFAVAATFGASAGVRIAETEVVFEDGSVDRIPWKMEQTVYALDDPRSTPESPLLWQRKPRTPEEPPAAIHGHLWKNPTPEKPIRELIFRSDRRGSALMLFGVTGVEGR